MTVVYEHRKTQTASAHDDSDDSDEFALELHATVISTHTDCISGPNISIRHSLLVTVLPMGGEMVVKIGDYYNTEGQNVTLL